MYVPVEKCDGLIHEYLSRVLSVLLNYYENKITKYFAIVHLRSHAKLQEKRNSQVLITKLYGMKAFLKSFFKTRFHLKNNIVLRNRNNDTLNLFAQIKNKRPNLTSKKFAQQWSNLMFPWQRKIWDNLLVMQNNTARIFWKPFDREYFNQYFKVFLI